MGCFADYKTSELTPAALKTSEPQIHTDEDDFADEYV